MLKMNLKLLVTPASYINYTILKCDILLLMQL